MNDFNRTYYFLLSVVCLHATIAFKLPGLSSSSSSGGSGNRAPPAGKAPPGHNKGADGNEYAGPVFIIRELQNKDNNNGDHYDAFITTGGIQEVKPAAVGGGGGHGHHPAAPSSQNKPPAGYERDEDSEYFGVLVTPDTVKQLELDRSTALNVSMSVLLTAAASRMPWLMVLRRESYPQLFQRFEQQQPPPSAAAATPFADMVPGMQIPQRRGYNNSPPDTQRRGYYSPDRHRRDARHHYPAALADRSFAEPSLSERRLFERQLLSTMCYNFVRENADGEPKLQIELVRPDDDFQLMQSDNGDPVSFNKKPYVYAAINRDQPLSPSVTPTPDEQFIA